MLVVSFNAESPESKLLTHRRLSKWRWLQYRFFQANQKNALVFHHQSGDAAWLQLLALASVHGDMGCTTAITGKHPKLINKRNQESYETGHVHRSTYCGFATTETVDINNSWSFLSDYTESFIPD